MEPFYRKILKRSWKISRKNKWLWFFGFFATFLGGSTFYETVIRSFSNMAEGRSIFYTLREYSNTGIFGLFSWNKIVDFWQQDQSLLIFTLFTTLILFIIAIIFLILAIISQAGIIKSAILLDENKKISFGEAFRSGADKFWPVLWLNIFMKIVLFGLVLFLAFCVSLLAIKESLIISVIYIVSLVILLLLGIMIYFLTIYANAYIVLRDKKVFSSIASAWHLFKKNVWLNFEMGLIMFLVQTIVGIITILISLFILSPFILMYFLLIVMGINVGISVIGIVIVLLFMLLLTFVGSWFTTFHISTWAILFEELALKKGQSKLARIIAGLRSKRLATKKNKIKKSKKKITARKKKQK